MFLRGHNWAAALILVLAPLRPAFAAEASLFSREPDPITTSCGGRCTPTVYVGPHLATPMARASVDSFSTARRTSSRPRAFDAVEGTDRDPLSNKTYDLNFPKTVPVLRGP